MPERTHPARHRAAARSRRPRMAGSCGDHRKRKTGSGQSRPHSRNSHCWHRHRFEPHADRRPTHGKRAEHGVRLEFLCVPAGSLQPRRMAQIGVGANNPWGRHACSPSTQSAIATPWRECTSIQASSHHAGPCRLPPCSSSHRMPDQTEARRAVWHWTEKPASRFARRVPRFDPETRCRLQPLQSVRQRTERSCGRAHHPAANGTWTASAQATRSLLA